MVANIRRVHRITLLGAEIMGRMIDSRPTPLSVG